MKKSVSIADLDEFDHKLLALLSRDGRMSVTALAAQVGLSKTPCQARLKKLQESGVITGFRAVLDLSLIHI